MSKSLITNAKYNFLKRFAGTKIVEPTTKSRLIDAAKATAVSLIGGALVAMAIKKGLKANALRKIKNALTPQKLRSARESYVKVLKTNPFSPKMMAANATLGTLSGLYERDIRNSIVRANLDPSKKMEALQTMQKIQDIKSKARASFRPNMEKDAFWGSLARGGLSAAKTVGFGLLPMGKGKFGQFARGRFGITGTPTLAHKAWGIGVKGAVGTGAFFGGRAAYRKISDNQRSGEYTTFLRNNMLAGNIQPNELSLPDMEGVRGLGMQ